MDTTRPRIHQSATLATAAPAHAQQGMSLRIETYLVKTARRPGGAEASIVAALAPRQAATEFKSMYAPTSIDIVHHVIIHPMRVIGGVAVAESVVGGGTSKHEGCEQGNRKDGASTGPCRA